MTKSQETQLVKKGIFTLQDAEKIGLPQYAISRLVKSGTINRVGRGLYIHANAKATSQTTFEVATAKFGPHSAIGGMTALYHYNLIEEVPSQTWIVVPPNVWTKEKGFRLMRTKSGTDVGINAEKGFRIVSIERALIEALKYSTKIGASVAIKAVRNAIKEKATTMNKLRKMATDLKMDSVLARHIESIML